MRVLAIPAFASLILLAAAPVLMAQTNDPSGDSTDWRDCWHAWEDFDGFHLHADDLELHTGGRFAIDAVKYNHANDRRSGLELDDARLFIEGRYGILSWWIEPDLVGVDTPRNFYEFRGTLELEDDIRVTFGQMRVALGSEFATREEDFPLVGYGFTSYLDGRYDTGVRLDSDLLDGGFWYEATFTTGHGFGLEGHRRQNPQYSLRLVGHPFRLLDSEATGALDGFYAGVALAFSPDGDEPVILATPFESTVFRTPDLDGDSTEWRHIELGFASGPFRAGWERVSGSTDDVPIGGGLKTDMDQLTAWTLFASINLTGEEQVWDRGGWRRPRSRSEDGGWLPLPGRWEIGARYSNADIDRSLFDYGYTGYDPSTQEVRTFSLDLNWHPNDRAALTLGWVKTLADHELATFGGTNRDSSFVLRLGLTF
jgi:hypothetical protein